MRDPDLKPIAGSGDRDIRNEKALSFLRRASVLEQEAQRSGMTTHVIVERVAELRQRGNAILALVREFDEAPYRQAVTR